MNASIGRKSLGGRWRALAIGLGAAFVVLVLLGLASARFPRTKELLHALDQRAFHESFKDAVGRFVVGEDWSRLTPLAPRQDYRWLDEPRGMIPIAHGLGEISGQINSLPALHRSIAAGFRFFEVDLWMEGDVIHCFHGPGIPPTLAANDCTFESLVGQLPTDGWLVLDIKTDFLATGNRIVEALRSSGRADHVIFQLYKPEHFAMFERWQAQVPLPGPIMTAYVARRSSDTVAAAAARAGVRAFTVPLDRLDGFSRRPPSMAVFVHPIDDCRSLEQVRAVGIRGVYMENNLGCLGMPSISRSGTPSRQHEDSSV